MRNKIFLKRFAITAAAALIAGLAGNAQAIPSTLRSLAIDQAQPSTRPMSRKQSSAVFMAASSTTSVVAQKSSRRGSVVVVNNRRRGVVVPVTPVLTPVFTPVTDQGAYPVIDLHAPLLPPAPVSLPQPPILVVSGGGSPAPNAVSVPDGGSTATLMAGSVCGLALLRRKLKA